MISKSTLRSVCFAKFHSQLRYDIIFWGGDSSSTQVLKMQEKVVHIKEGVSKRESCRRIFKKYKVLIVILLYLFAVLCHIKKYNINVKKPKYS